MCYTYKFFCRITYTESFPFRASKNAIYVEGILREVGHFFKTLSKISDRICQIDHNSVPLKNDCCEFFQIAKIIILGHTFFFHIHISSRGWVTDKT